MVRLALFEVDRELAFENASKLASAAEEAGLEVMVSMEGSERTDEVLGLYRRLYDRHENVGITLQACLRRTPRDLEDALERRGKIRLVKGAFEEPEDVAMSRGRDLDGAYRSFVERLLANGHPTSVSTHDQGLPHLFVLACDAPYNPEKKRVIRPFARSGLS